MWIGYILEGKRGKWQQTEQWGLPIYRVTMPEGRGVARWCRAQLWRKLRRRGVRQCVMAEMWAAEAAQWGITPVETQSLRLALLPQFLPPLEGQTVALRAERVSGAVVEAAFLLARRARYVTLQIDRGGEKLAQELRRRYGLSANGGTAAETVDFTGTVPGAISLGKTGRMVCFLQEETVPEGIAALLLTRGRVKKEGIRVKSPPRNA